MTDKELTRTSKYISLILRHKPEAAGISLDSHGWADVKELLKAIKLDMNDLEYIVDTDEKQRYSFNANKTKIRANQGHSIDVDVELEKKLPPNKLYHGTAYKVLDDIMKYGLSKRSRQHVHLSANIDTAIKVGERRGTPVVLEIDTESMSNDGHIFYMSKNGVWLTDNVPTKYIKISK